MDIVSELQPLQIITGSGVTIVIGRIRGEHAIYTVPAPTVTQEDLKRASFTDDGRLSVGYEVVPRLIYPATAEHVKKYTARGVCVSETYEAYLKSADFLSTSWLDNIVRLAGSGPGEISSTEMGVANEQTVFDSSEYLVIYDYKWDRKSNDRLYLLMIFKEDRLRSLRDVDDVALLERARADILSLCAGYGLGERDVCLFFHYRPSYFRLHIHIVNIAQSLSCVGSMVRDVLLDDAIRNLKADPQYYKRDCPIVTIQE
ncbi:m7GpppX diphosphatase [Pancytospora philotis]|nr:m7GpppX diphosphatase [Pancytospora philotis]